MVLIVVAVVAGAAMAQTQSQSGDTVGEPPAPRPKHKPIDLEIEVPSFDFTHDVAKFLNDLHDDYRGFKKEPDYALSSAIKSWYKTGTYLSLIHI